MVRNHLLIMKSIMVCVLDITQLYNMHNQGTVSTTTVHFCIRRGTYVLQRCKINQKKPS